MKRTSLTLVFLSIYGIAFTQELTKAENAFKIQRLLHSIRILNLNNLLALSSITRKVKKMILNTYRS